VQKRKILSLINENREFLDGFSYSESKGLLSENLKGSKSLFGPNWNGPENLIKKRGFYLSVEKLSAIGKMLLKGFSEYGISKKLKCHIDTVKEFRKYVELSSPGLSCKCGRIANHKSICRYKLMRLRKKHPENLRYR
jgi:hypothetical protein